MTSLITEIEDLLALLDEEERLDNELLAEIEGLEKEVK
jgi:hypothetical protein